MSTDGILGSFHILVSSAVTVGPADVLKRLSVPYFLPRLRKLSGSFPGLNLGCLGSGWAVYELEDFKAWHLDVKFTYQESERVHGLNKHKFLTQYSFELSKSVLVVPIRTKLQDDAFNN